MIPSEFIDELLAKVALAYESTQWQKIDMPFGVQLQ